MKQANNKLIINGNKWIHTLTSWGICFVILKNLHYITLHTAVQCNGLLPILVCRKPLTMPFHGHVSALSGTKSAYQGNDPFGMCWDMIVTVMLIQISYSCYCVGVWWGKHGETVRVCPVLACVLQHKATASYDISFPSGVWHTVATQCSPQPLTVPSAIPHLQVFGVPVTVGKLLLLLIVYVCNAYSSVKSHALHVTKLTLTQSLETERDYKPKLVQK